MNTQDTGVIMGEKKQKTVSLLMKIMICAFYLSICVIYVFFPQRFQLLCLPMDDLPFDHKCLPPAGNSSSASSTEMKTLNDSG